MDFIGEIIEHDTEVPKEPIQVASQNGFPEPGKLKQKKMSRFKQKQQLKQNLQPDNTKSPSTPLEKEKPQSEAESIHKENLERISKMTDSEILQEREELLRGLNPKLIQSLINKSKSREPKNTATGTACDSCSGEPLHNHQNDSNDHDHHHHHHAEGYNGWIGSIKTPNGLTDLSQLDKDDVDRALGIQPLIHDDYQESSSQRKVRFDNDIKTVNYEDLDEDIELDPNGWEDVDDINELVPNANAVAPQDYQINEDSDDEEKDDDNSGDGTTVHFTKPKQDDLDLNDPDFFDKLHEKYYPDLPKETEKLSWMMQPVPKLASTTYESISDMRFDFKGDLVQLNLEEKAEDEDDESTSTPTYLGLHHHSDNPHMAGYTLGELAHLSRSTLAAQRCISIQTLGRILHKLGLHKYSIMPISDPDDAQLNDDIQQLLNNLENMMWDVIDELRIIETITDAADEKKTSNFSVRNYAIEALWLYKSGGGRPEAKAQDEVDEITKAVQP